MRLFTGRLESLEEGLYLRILDRLQGLGAGQLGFQFLPPHSENIGGGVVTQPLNLRQLRNCRHVLLCQTGGRFLCLSSGCCRQKQTGRQEADHDRYQDMARRDNESEHG